MASSKGKVTTAGEMVAKMRDSAAFEVAEARRDLRFQEESDLRQRLFDHSSDWTLPQIARILASKQTLTERQLRDLREALERSSELAESPTLEVVQRQLVALYEMAPAGYDARPLVRIFEATKNPSLAWAIANLFFETRPQLAREWFRGAIQDSRHGKAREMLLLAMARQFPDATTAETIRSEFREFPGHAAMALAECGGPQDLAFLQRQGEGLRVWERKKVTRAIAILSSRTR